MLREIADELSACESKLTSSLRVTTAKYASHRVLAPSRLEYFFGSALGILRPVAAALQQRRCARASMQAVRRQRDLKKPHICVRLDCTASSSGTERAAAVAEYRAGPAHRPPT